MTDRPIAAHGGDSATSLRLIILLACLEVCQLDNFEVSRYIKPFPMFAVGGCRDFWCRDGEGAKCPANPPKFRCVG